MTWEHIAVLAGVVLLALAVLVVVGGRQMRRVLADFDAGRPVPVPPLPDVDPDGWSSQVGWSAWREWLELRTLSAPAAGTTDPAIFDEMDGDRVLSGRRPQLAIGPAPQRELEGATK